MQQGTGTRALQAIGAVVLIVAGAVSGGPIVPGFVVANNSSGINYLHTLNTNDRFSRRFATGPAAADFDKDGDIDIFLPQAFDYPNELYMNNGDGTFTEIAQSAGVDSLKESRAALWIDYDGDGWLDLFVANDPDAPDGQTVPDPATVRNQLYRNLGNRTFAPMASSAGVDLVPMAGTSQTVGGLAAADIDNDDDVDIYVSYWGNVNALYINNGQGGFIEDSFSAGVSEPGTSWTPMFFDADRDGWMDLLLNMDFGPNRLLNNLQNGSFTNIAHQVGFASSFNEMGMSLGDFDDDGDLDVLASNIETPYADTNALDKYTVLLHNHIDTGTLAFTECATSVGVARTGWGWGATWFDCNNDGWVDLGVTNGFNESSPYATDPSRFFLNIGGGQFAEMSTSVGFDSTLQGRGLIALDFDEDGDLDLYETNYNDKGFLYRNDVVGAGHYLKVRLSQPGGNGRAIGGEVTVSAGGLMQTRLVSAGTSFLSQEPYLLFFGLGTATVADSVQVRWPDGVIESFGPVGADRRVRIVRGVGVVGDGDINADGVVDDADLGVLAGCAVGPVQGAMLPGCAFADIDQDRDVDLADYARLMLAVP